MQQRSPATPPTPSRAPSSGRLLSRVLTPRNTNTNAPAQTPLCSPHPFAKFREDINPFPDLDAWLQARADADSDSLLSGAHTPAVTPPHGSAVSVRWSIDDLAQLMPTEMELRAAQFETPDARTLTPRQRQRLEQRRQKVQADCEQFFHPSNRIVPSPATANRPGGTRYHAPHADALMECSGLADEPAAPPCRNAACQTAVTCPWDMSLEEFYTRQRHGPPTQIDDDDESEKRGPLMSSPDVSLILPDPALGEGPGAGPLAQVNIVDDDDDLCRLLFTGDSAESDDSVAAAFGGLELLDMSGIECVVDTTGTAAGIDTSHDEALTALTTHLAALTLPPSPPAVTPLWPEPDVPDVRLRVTRPVARWSAPDALQAPTGAVPDQRRHSCPSVRGSAARAALSASADGNQSSAAWLCSGAANRTLEF